MATVYPTATGNWSTRTWNDDSTGAAYGAGTPQAGDTVLANGTTVTIDQDITVVEIKTTAGTNAAAGGVFQITANATRVVTANVTAGTTTCLSISSGTSSATITITGNITGGAIGSNTYGLNITKTSGITYVNGNSTGGSGGSNSNGITIIGSSTVIISGNCIGGSASGADGAGNGGDGTIIVNGSAIGGSHNTAYGLYNATTGTCTVTTAIGHATTGAVGAYNNSTGLLTVTNIEYGANGIRPVGSAAGRSVFFTNPATASAKITKADYSTATIGGAGGGPRGVNVNGGVTQ